MAIDRENEAKYRLHYQLTPDRFTLENATSYGKQEPDEALLVLGDHPSEFIIFNNYYPGRIEYATHRGDNFEAAALLGETALDATYRSRSESLRARAVNFNDEEYQLNITVPLSSQKFLARLALHAIAIGATTEVAELYRLLATKKIERVDNSTDSSDETPPTLL